MPFVEVIAEQWNTIATTAVDTVFQNRSSETMCITAESTGGLPIDEGFQLLPGDAVVFGAGLDVKASTFNVSGNIFYTELT